MSKNIEIDSVESAEHNEEFNASSIMQNQYVQVGTKMLVTSVGVASVLYPLDVYKTLLQVDGMSPKSLAGARGASPFMWSYRALSPLISGFINANKSSLVKNSVLSNRETVSSSVDGIISEKKIEHNAIKKHQGLFITTGIIAGLDTTFTQYYSNTRVLNSLDETPTLSRMQKLLFAKEGMLIRGGRNYLTTLACIGTNAVLSEQLAPYLPRETEPFTHDAATSIAGGFAIAPIINALDVIYKNKIKQVDMETLKTPSVGKVISDLWSKNKFASFTRGSATTGVYTALAFMTVNGISIALDKYVFPKAEPAIKTPVKHAENRNSFFGSTLKKEPPVVAEVDAAPQETSLQCS